MKIKKKKILWFSCGVTSAVACKLALDKYGKDNCHVAYIRISSAHNDNIRFLNMCEYWYDTKIYTYQSKKYLDQFQVVKKKRFINSAFGAPCTLELKKKVRIEIEKQIYYDGQVFGFEFEKKEINRAIRFQEQYPDSKPIYPLIENKLTKSECIEILETIGIERPIMYKLGYHNNNCIGCVKGGMGYWNKIKIDFPYEFKQMMYLENEIGYSCIKNKFLKDLKPTDGRHEEPIAPSCGLFCQIEFENLMSDKVKDIMAGYSHSGQAI